MKEKMTKKGFIWLVLLVGIAAWICSSVLVFSGTSKIRRNVNNNYQLNLELETFAIDKAQQLSGKPASSLYTLDNWNFMMSSNREQREALNSQNFFWKAELNDKELSSQILPDPSSEFYGKMQVSNGEVHFEGNVFPLMFDPLNPQDVNSWLNMYGFIQDQSSQTTPEIVTPDSVPADPEELSPVLPDPVPADPTEAESEKPDSAEKADQDSSETKDMKKETESKEDSQNGKPESESSSPEESKEDESSKLQSDSAEAESQTESIEVELEDPAASGSALQNDPVQVPPAGTSQVLPGETSAIVLPEGFTLEVGLPSTLTKEDTWVYRALVDREAIISQLIWITVISCAALTLISFLWNLQAMDQVFLLHWLASWDALALVVFFWLAGMLSCTFTLISGEQAFTFASEAGARPGIFLFTSVIAGAFVFMTDMLCVAICFWIRSVFHAGIKKYFRTHCYLLDAAKKLVRVVSDQTIGQPSRIWIPVVLGGLVILAFCFNAGFSNLLSLIPLIFLAAWIVWFYQQVTSGYQTILKQATQLSLGEFGKLSHEDAGLFEPVSQKLELISNAYEKTLQEELESRNMRNELIENVSHDLKTPLTGLRNYSELLIRAKDPQQVKEYAEHVKDYTNRLAGLVDDLFDISKANSGSLELDIMPVQIAPVVEHAFEEYQKAFDQKHLTLINNLSTSKVVVPVDPYKTLRIFDNLASNISKYAMPGSRVYADLVDGDQNIEIIIKNMSEGTLNLDPKTVTDRFVRGDHSRHEPGSGLGLAIVQSFAEAQNGRCEIQIDGDLFKTILTFPKTNLNVDQAFEETESVSSVLTSTPLNTQEEKSSTSARQGEDDLTQTNESIDLNHASFEQEPSSMDEDES